MKRLPDPRLLLAAEILLASGLVVAPLALGGVPPWCVGLATLLSLAAAGCTLTDPRRVPWPVWVAFGVTAFVGLQAVPLPPGVQRVLSPRAAELLDLVGHTTWRSIAIDPAAAWREMVRLLGFSAALFAASRLAAHRYTAVRLAKVIVALSLVEVGAVAVHRIIGTNEVYGLFPVSNMASVLGTFATANPFAAYLNLSLPLVMALAVRAKRPAMRRAGWAVVAVQAAVVLLTGSRSGLLGLGVGLVASFFLLVRPRYEHPWRWASIGGAVFATCLAGMVLFAPSYRARLASLGHPIGLLNNEEKVAVWRDVPALVAGYPLTGVGRGSFEQIFPMYKHRAWTMTYSHVECAPLQALADLGLVVGGVLLVAWAAALTRAARRARGSVQRGAVAALLAVTAHDLGDFSLEISVAVGLTTAVLWGLALPARESTRPPPAPAWSLTVVPVIALAALAFGWSWRHDLRRDIVTIERLSAAQDPELAAALHDVLERHPAEPWFPTVAADVELRAHHPADAIRMLNRLQILDPTSWRGHALAGQALLQAGHRDQALLEMRLAYRASKLSPAVASLVAARGELLDGDGLARFVGDDDAVLAAFARFLDQHEDRHAGEASVLWFASHPDDPEVRRLRTRALLRAHDFGAALALANSLPQDGEGLLLRLAALDGLGRGSDAEILLSQQAGSAHLGSAHEAIRIAQRALAARLPAVALGILDRSPASEGVADEALVHLARGQALEQQGEGGPPVLREYQVAARLDPSEANRLALGAAYERAGLVRQALVEYRSLARSLAHPSGEVAARLERLRGEFRPSDPEQGSP